MTEGFEPAEVFTDVEPPVVESSETVYESLPRTTVTVNSHPIESELNTATLADRPTSSPYEYR